MRTEGSWRTRGTDRADYLCDACYKKKVAAEGEEFRRNMGCLVACFKFVFGGIGWIFKTCWRMTKWCGRVACKIMFNKWSVTIFTFGMAWAAWKILDKIYGKK